MPENRIAKKILNWNLLEKQIEIDLIEAEEK